MIDPTADINRHLAAQAGWTAFDDYLLYTCVVVHDLVTTDLANVTPRPTTMRLRPGDICLAEGPALLYHWRAVGDGTWQRSSPMVLGSLPFVAAVQLGAAVSNRSRRMRAAADSQPRWVPERPGSATVTREHVVFANPEMTVPLRWAALDTIDLVAADRFACRYSDSRGLICTVQLQSPWAPLMFAVAAHTAFSAHPLLQSGGWLPPGFEDKCYVAGKTCPQVRHARRA